MKYCHSIGCFTVLVLICFRFNGWVYHESHDEVISFRTIQVSGSYLISYYRIKPCVRCIFSCNNFVKTLEIVYEINHIISIGWLAQRKPHIKPAYLLPVIPNTYAWYLLADVWESYSEFCVIRRSVEFVCSIPGKSCGRVCVKDLTVYLVIFAVN